MAKVEVELQKGLLLGEERQTIAVLRDPTVADMLEAAEESERLVRTADGPMLLQSPTLMSAALLCRQIERVGEIKGPLSMETLGMLSVADLDRLQSHADELDATLLQEMSDRGRDDSGGEEIN